VLQEADAPSFCSIEAEEPRAAFSLLPPIVAAVTFDEQGRQCLRHACQRAARTGEPVIALHIVHETVRDAGLYRRHDRGQVALPFLDVAKRLLADFTAEVIAGAPNGAQLDLRELAVQGVPETSIAKIAALTGAGLIVVGGRPKERLERLFGRTVTRDVLRRAECPVLVIDVVGNAVDPKDLVPGRQDRSYPPAMQAR